MTVYTYRADQELPALTLSWTDADGTLIDFSSGYTFTVKLALASAPNTIVTSKTTNITGAATTPNITVDWATTDWSGFTAVATGTKVIAHVYARRTADTKDRVFRPSDPVQITLYPSPA